MLSNDPTFCHFWCFRWACCYLLPLGSPLLQRLGAFELGSFISGLIWVPHFQFPHLVPYRSIYRPNRNENALCTSSRWPSLVYAPLGSSLVQRFGAFGLGSYIFVLIWVPHFCFSRVVLYRSIYIAPILTQIPSVHPPGGSPVSASHFGSPIP